MVKDNESIFGRKGVLLAAGALLVSAVVSRIVGGTNRLSRLVSVAFAALGTGLLGWGFFSAKSDSPARDGPDQKPKSINQPSAEENKEVVSEPHQEESRPLTQAKVKEELLNLVGPLKSNEAPSIALLQGNPDITSDVDFMSEVLEVAVLFRHNDFVKEALKINPSLATIQIHATNHGPMRGLSYVAAQRGNRDLLEHMLKAYPGCQHAPEGQGSLLSAALVAPKFYPEMVHWLLEKEQLPAIGFKVDAIGRTPCHNLAQMVSQLTPLEFEMLDFHKTMDTVIDADPSAIFVKDKRGYTPLALFLEVSKPLMDSTLAEKVENQLRAAELKCLNMNGAAIQGYGEDCSTLSLGNLSNSLTGPDALLRRQR